MSEKTREVTAQDGDTRQTQSRNDLHGGNGHHAASLTDADRVENFSGGLEDSDVDAQLGRVQLQRVSEGTAAPVSICER